MTPPYWYQAVQLGLNVAQTVALAYVTSRWRSVNGQLKEAQRREERHRRR